MVALQLYMKKIQKRIRLKNFSYIGTYRYFVTICVDRKRNIFINNELVNLCITILHDLAEKYLFDIWVYCFMPDHLHILCEGRDEKSDFRKFISVFKQKSSYYVVRTFKFAFYKNMTKLWQENYFERVLRKEEDTIDVVKYILNNPVRKGLVKEYSNYPYSGSFKLEIKNL